MYEQLHADRQRLDQILASVLEDSVRFLNASSSRPAGVVPPASDAETLPEAGIGATATHDLFQSKYADWMSGSAGPHYFGLVTGGATPASIAGDWLTTIYDQNATGSEDSIAPQIELAAIGMLRQLFGLSSAQAGVFVSGATMANFVGLATARQSVGHRNGVDIAKSGLSGLSPIHVLCGTPHSSVSKAMAMLGLGRDNMERIATLPGREAVDVGAMRKRLTELSEAGQSCVVVGNAGTVNSVDYDDLNAVADLCSEFAVWLHVDAAFGGFAACVPEKQSLVAGMDRADSITIDAHKWLNVPYDSAMIFTRHLHLQREVFQNAAAYLEADPSPSNFVNLTPENSRRFRALPAWFTLMAYGRDGYREIVTRNCQIAEEIGKRIDASSAFRLLAPVRMNGIVFTLAGDNVTHGQIQAYLQAVQVDGVLYMTPTEYFNAPAIRISVSNWRTTEHDIADVWNGMLAALESASS
ncbi:Pyridoxal phosphate-dependent decarboxylase [Rhodopirellula maiorica SM1]|uniref:Pyridoxal phosphate-dependent decarboxylase n=1 Tax=Rhodopirellula maiorica SM1 TaxID=1265738 RepID=M5RDU6_9BACT|nr:pyridoxal-dependent decarboxylase [Rhodopirellula maiorica]EMI17241.1 Pyridoxal phosphate-dependent decarboxylase [Rhodopirellula maiorica SM1]